MKSIRTILAASLAAALLGIGALSLAGCGPSAEEVVRQGVTDELERLKAHDDVLLDELAAESGAVELAAYGIDAKEFLAAYLDGFDYRIDEVKVEGDEATATVVLTCKRFDAFAQALEEASAALAADEAMAGLTEEELNERVGQAVLESLASVAPVESAPIALPFSRTDNMWGPAPGIEKALSDALFAG